MVPIITAAFTPAIALLIFFYLKDEFEQEPLTMVIRCFIFGTLLVFPVMFIQFVLQNETRFTSPFIETFLQVALTEEFFKWFIVLVTVFYHVHFSQRYDGIVYATAVALGFASVENLLYIIAHGLDTAFIRAVFPVTSHALFGVVMGYYFGKAKFQKQKRYRYLFMAFLIPYLLHSLYNLILLSMNQWIYVLIPFMVFLWVFALKKVKKANQLQAVHLVKRETG
ncbi:glutamic-type intramembrane protease PrsW [Salipaludibacillus aurantiacus]|uniref:Protease PrsW n=1 Tax=Salipaludibacillus aurantiacus TaxID=1601833 RepID=A0A1H9PAY7_9BACI|nr:glutamic-type intramembrane protease PrsW [Salipaludibacillus aurantiacus]SER45085.1 Membrane proteinase PrsW, cleaves anti-sigma factor RsiW, M82 family [Salipaludibacillus aurantiacus]